MIHGFYGNDGKVVASEVTKELQKTLKMSPKQNLKRVLICYPENEKTEEEIDYYIERAKSYIMAVEMVPVWVQGMCVLPPPVQCNERIWNVGRAVRALSSCDYAYFCQGWKFDRETRSMHDICEDFEIPILADEEDFY